MRREEVWGPLRGKEAWGEDGVELSGEEVWGEGEEETCGVELGAGEAWGQKDKMDRRQMEAVITPSRGQMREGAGTDTEENLPLAGAEQVRGRGAVSCFLSLPLHGNTCKVRLTCHRRGR